MPTSVPPEDNGKAEGIPPKKYNTPESQLCLRHWTRRVRPFYHHFLLYMIGFYLSFSELNWA